MQVRKQKIMRKTNFLFLLCLFMVNQLFAQQTKSFSEHWFGVNPQSKALKSTKATPEKATAKAILRAASANSDGVITLDLSKSLNPETFTYTPDGYWMETYNEDDYSFIEFEHFAFSHLIEGDSWSGSSWDGFTVCTSGDNANYLDEYGWDYMKQWGNMAGGGIKTDENGVVLKDKNGKVQVEQGIPYLLAYWGFGSFMDDYGLYYLQTILTDAEAPFEAVGVYVNASPWAYYSHIEGDGYARAFEEGDYFKLFIHGLDENYEDNGKVVEYILAEFTNGSLKQNPDWEWVDLSSLGEIYGFRYSMETTDSDPVWGPKTATYFCLDKLQIRKAPNIPDYTFTFTVPEDASVYVGTKLKTNGQEGGGTGSGDKHYVPFVEKQPVYSATSEGKTTYYYNLNSYLHNYRIVRAGKAPHVGIFTPNATNTGMEFSDEELSARNAKDIDHDVNSLNGRNVADVFLNINEKGYLRMTNGETKQLVTFRNWQAINTDVANYFIEPDYHYMIVDENGTPDNSVLTVNDKGLITAVGAGTAIVLVTYDAMLCHHTSNVVPSGTDLRANPALFSALWPENTGVFMVTVDAPESDITPNMTINENRNVTGTDKEVSYSIDAELDVLYYEADKGSFHYTFKPEGATSVEVATPVVDENMLSYSGFSTDSVTVNDNGSYTIRLGFGRNIVKLSSASGSEYQIVNAKPVTYTVSNATNPDEPFLPGDKVSIVFNTLYHPCNKQSGIYNASAGIQYTGFNTDFPLILGPGQYTFASKAQTYTFNIPDTVTTKEFTLINGVIKLNGFTSGVYGMHRSITLEDGIGVNMNAYAHTAFFGNLPDIHIRMKNGETAIQSSGIDKITAYPNPFVDYIIVNTTESGTAILYDSSGIMILNINFINGSNRINTSALPKGIYLLRIGNNMVKIVK